MLCIYNPPTHTSRLVEQLSWESVVVNPFVRMWFTSKVKKKTQKQSSTRPDWIKVTVRKSSHWPLNLLLPLCLWSLTCELQRITSLLFYTSILRPRQFVFHTRALSISVNYCVGSTGCLAHSKPSLASAELVLVHHQGGDAAKKLEQSSGTRTSSWV